MLLEAFHQSGARVGLVVQRPPRIEPAHQRGGDRALWHIALHQRRTKQPAAGIEQGPQMLEDHALVRPRCRQTMHHIVQGDGVEAAHIEHDRLQHIGPINLRVVARDATRGARETVRVQVEKRDARRRIRKSSVVQKVAGPHPHFEMIVAQVFAVRGKDALVRAAPDPGTETAEDEQVVERQAAARECGLAAVRVRRRRREGGVPIEHQGHGTRPCIGLTLITWRSGQISTLFAAAVQQACDPAAQFHECRDLRPR
jgi:hypothetical protein